MKNVNRPKFFRETRYGFRSGRVFYCSICFVASIYIETLTWSLSKHRNSSFTSFMWVNQCIDQGMNEYHNYAMILIIRTTNPFLFFVFFFFVFNGHHDSFDRFTQNKQTKRYQQPSNKQNHIKMKYDWFVSSEHTKSIHPNHSSILIAYVHALLLLKIIRRNIIFFSLCYGRFCV